MTIVARECTVNRNDKRASDLVVALFLAVILLLAWCVCLQHGVPIAQLALCSTALILFLVLTLPWQLRVRTAAPRLSLVIGAGLSLLTGLAGELLVLVALGWTLTLWAWLDSRLVPGEMRRVRALLPLTIFVLPWVDHDFAFISLGLRHAVASTAQSLLSFAGLLEVRSDTVAIVGGRPISITGDCDGRDTLQAMILVGFAAAFFFLGSRRSIWPWLPLLLVFAWLANTLRVLMICVGAAYLDLQIHGPLLHDGGGWLAIATMLLLCVLFFRGLQHVGPAIAPSCELPNWHQKNPQFTGRRMAGRQVLLWCLLLGCLMAGFLHRSVELTDDGSRLERIRQKSVMLDGSEVELTPKDIRRLGDARALRQVVSVAGQRFLVTAIDGTRNRHAVHDPTYCWEVIQSSHVTIPGGSANALRIANEGHEKDVLFWFSDGNVRHASPARYLVQTSIRRASLGNFGREPILIVVESLDSHPVNWFRFLDNFPLLDVL